jgi:hypothetical protein
MRIQGPAQIQGLIPEARRSRVSKDESPEPADQAAIPPFQLLSLSVVI